MCGIAGIKRMGPKARSAPIELERIQQLLLGIQHRGMDATGVCLQYEDGRLVVCKNDSPAWQFLEEKRTKAFFEEHLTDDVMSAILHTRAATTGSPRQNRNNHPVYVDKTAIVHNGMISNHDFLFKNNKWKREAEVDSDIIRKILDEKGLTPEGVKELNQMNGGAAIAAVSVEYPGKMLLARSRNPMVLGALKEEGLLMFASEKDALHAAARPYELLWRSWFKANSTQMLFSTVQDDHAMLWDDNGEEWYMEFKLWGQHAPVHRVYKCYEQFGEKSARKREEQNLEFVAAKTKEVAPDVITKKPARMKCPNPSCGAMLKFDASHEAVEMYRIQCPKCKTRLGDQA